MKPRRMPASVALALALSPAALAQPGAGLEFVRLPPESELTHHFCLGPCQCAPFGVTGALSGGMVLVPEVVEPPAYSRWRVASVFWSARTARGPEWLTGSGVLEDFGDFIQQRRLRLTLANSEGLVFEFDTGVVFGGLAPLHATSSVVVCDAYALSLGFFLPRCPADFDADGSVDPDDLADFVAGYFETSPDPRCDHNADGLVDPDDLSDYIADFFAGGACG